MSTVTEWRLTSAPVTAEQADRLTKSGLVHYMRAGDTATFASVDGSYLRAQQRLLADLMDLHSILESRTVTTTEWTQAAVEAVKARTKQ